MFQNSALLDFSRVRGVIDHVFSFFLFFWLGSSPPSNAWKGLLSDA